MMSRQVNNFSDLNKDIDHSEDVKKQLEIADRLDDFTLMATDVFMDSDIETMKQRLLDWG